MRSIVVVGASLAAVNVIDELRSSGYQGTVTLIGAEPDLPYDRPPLSKEALRSGPNREGLLLRPRSWYDQNEVALVLGRRASDLDLHRQVVRLDDGSEFGYDGLAVTTGTQVRTVNAPNEAGPVYALRSVGDAEALRRELEPSRRLVVVGAGFIGLELAATARQMGLDVEVVELGRAPLSRALGDEAGDWFKSLHASHGVTIRCGHGLERISMDGASTRVHLRDRTVLTADIIAAGVGVTPTTGWLRTSGLALSDGVLCDATLRSSDPRVVAAGDVARWYNAAFDEQMRVEHWTNAVEQGRHAARTLIGAAHDAYTAEPYFWSDQYDARVRFVGRANAADTVFVEHRTDRSLIVLYGRDGLLLGALCVNAARRLAELRGAIRERTQWRDAVLA